MEVSEVVSEQRRHEKDMLRDVLDATARFVNPDLDNGRIRTAAFKILGLCLCGSIGSAIILVVTAVKSKRNAKPATVEVVPPLPARKKRTRVYEYDTSDEPDTENVTPVPRKRMRKDVSGDRAVASTHLRHTNIRQPKVYNVDDGNDDE